MIPARFIRSRATALWRALSVLVVVAGAVTCDVPTSLHRAAIAIAPVFGKLSMSGFGGMAVDSVRLKVIRPPSDTIARKTFAFSPDSAAITASLSVDLNSSHEQLLVLIEFLSNSQVVFTGTQTVDVVAGSTTSAPTSVPISYVGPGSSIAALHITPRDTGVLVGATVPYVVTATDSSNQPVTQFYVRWSASRTADVINAVGSLRAGATPGVGWVYARTPAGIEDSTTIIVAATATPGNPATLTKVAGDGQTALPGAAVTVAPRVRVLDANSIGVPNMQVVFAVTSGGGSVTGGTVATDANGFAQPTSWTLGAVAGANTLTASLPAFPAVTAQVFSATGASASPTIFITLPGSLIAVGDSAALQVRLVPTPSSPVTVTITSDSTQYVTVSPPGTVSFVAGDTLKTIRLRGIALGGSIIHATAPGYTAGLAGAAVTPNLILLASPVTVGVGQTTTDSIHIVPAAPVGGLAITMVSQDTTIFKVTTPLVTIPAGQIAGVATIQGIAAGTVALMAQATGYANGGALVTVTSGGATPSTLTKTAGDGLTAFINDTTTIRPQVKVLDAVGAPVSGVQVLFAVVVGGGTVSGLPSMSATTNASGLATVGPWKMGASAGKDSLLATIPSFPAVTPVVFGATATLPPPVIQLSVFGSTVVGEARTGTLNVKLLQAAPVGGLVVTVTSDSTNYLTVGAYGSPSGTVNFVQGDTLKTISVFGDSTHLGIAVVRATAPGYTSGTLNIPVSQNLISLPTALNVPLNNTASLSINLSFPAPAGGVVVALSSSDITKVTLTAPTVTVPAGSQIANATVQGVALGGATVTATNPNYAPFASNVSVTASLKFATTSVSLNSSFGSPAVIQLQSGGSSVAAPAGGVAVTMTSRNATCAVAPSTTIAAGLVSAAVNVTYGGSATLPCNTYIVASGPTGFVIDSASVNVQPQPALSVSSTYLGSGLQRQIGAFLGASNHGGTTVHVASANPSLFVIATNDSTPGAAFQDIAIPINGTSFTFYMQALDTTVTNDSANVTLTAPGFITVNSEIHVYRAVFDIIFLSGTGNTRSANNLFQVRTGSPSGPATGISVEDAVRAGSAPVTLSVVNDSTAVGKLVTTATGASGTDSVTVQIAPRQARSPSTVPLGGVQFKYVAAGVTNVRASAPSFRPVGPALGQLVTVTAPTISLSTAYIGAMLQRAVTGFLAAAGQAGDTVTLKVKRPGVLKIGPNDSTFADSIQIPIGVNATSFTYYIQGVDSIVNDTVSVLASMPSFSSGQALYSVYKPVFDIIFLNGSGNTRSANNLFEVRTGSPSGPATGISIEDNVRFGVAPITFSVVNDSTAVGKLVTTATGAGGADSVTVQIGPRQARSPGTVVSGGVAFKYVAAGVANVRASAPGFRSVGPALGQLVTVTAPNLTISSTYIGGMLQRPVSGFMAAQGQAGDTVTLKVKRPGVLRIGPNDSTFADSIQIPIGVGATSFTYYIQGVDTATNDTVSVLATMPFYNGSTALYSVFQPVEDIIFLNTSATTLTANNVFEVRTGSPSSVGSGISVEDNVRFGATANAIVRSNQSTVAQLVTQAATGDSVTVTIGPRLARSPGTVATGGVALDYLTAGQTVISASIPGFRSVGPALGTTVTVVAPAVTLSPIQVGSGLQTNGFGSMTAAVPAGGATLVVKSSNPAVALVSPDAVTAGTDSIVVALAQGATSFNYYVQGVEGLTGAPQQTTFTATVTGFTQGTATMTVVQPAVDIIFLSSSGSAATTADVVFEARTGYANAPNNTGMSVEQAVRAGAPGPLTVTIQSTNPAAGLLKTTPTLPTGAGTVTVQIPVGQARSPGTIASGGVSFDFIAQGITFVVPTITNYITVQESVQGTPGFQVTVNP